MGKSAGDNWLRDTEGQCLGQAAERWRLERRVVRLERVLRALNDRAVERGRAQDVPLALRDAIDGFVVELAAARRRLADH